MINSRRCFPKWRGLASADTNIIKKIIGSAGLGNQRAKEIINNLKIIKSEFGSETLEPLRQWSNSKALEFLLRLNGIGPKSALCILMYSFRRQVFPVDTHVQTVCERLGFISPRLHHDEAQIKTCTIISEKYEIRLAC